MIYRAAVLDVFDLAPYARLRSVAVLRDLIRKWWKLELFFVDAAGEPLAPPGSVLPGAEVPRPIPRDNDFCRLSLHAPAGARRCAESLRVTLDKLRQSGRAERVLCHECHLGFDVVACSLWLDGELAGLLAVSGFTHEPWTAFGEAQLLRKVREVAPAAGSGTDLERALRRLPFLSKVEVEQLEDLLQLCAAEIEEFHEERRRAAAAAQAAVEASAEAEAEAAEGPGLLREALESLERDLIQKGLLRTGGNKSQLARELGISRSNLMAKVDRYRLE